MSVGVSIVVSVSATGQKFIMLVSCGFGAKLVNTFSFDEIFTESRCEEHSYHNRIIVLFQ